MIYEQITKTKSFGEQHFQLSNIKYEENENAFVPKCINTTHDNSFQKNSILTSCMQKRNVDERVANPKKADLLL